MTTTTDTTTSYVVAALAVTFAASISLTGGVIQFFQ